MSGTALEALRPFDQAKYLACLFVPEQKREAFAAIVAFAEELRRIPLLVSEPLPGEIRLQWWRDVIAGERVGEAANQAVATGLLAAIQHYRLPIAPLDAMAEARIFDLYHDPMPDGAALETYLGETEATLIQIGGIILDPDNAQKAAQAAGHAGMAIGIANILRNLPRATNRQRMFMPVTLLSAIASDAEQIFAGDEGARTKAVTAMVALGRDHLKLFKRLAKTVTPQLRPAFLGVALVEPILRKAEKAGAAAYLDAVNLPPLMMPIRLAYRAMRGW